MNRTTKYTKIKGMLWVLFVPLVCFVVQNLKELGL